MSSANGMTYPSQSRLANSRIPRRFASREYELLPPVEAYAAKLEGSFGRGVFSGPWLVMHGTKGSGKTSQACQVLKRCLSYRLGQFWTVRGYLDAVQYGWDHADSIDVASCARGTALLVLDDFGKERMTEWTCSTLFELLDYRHASEKATIITSNDAPNALARAIGEAAGKTMADALMSRIADQENVILAVSGADRRRAHG